MLDYKEKVKDRADNLSLKILTLTAIRRSGADMILTYFSIEAARVLSNQ